MLLPRFGVGGVSASDRRKLPVAVTSLTRWSVRLRPIWASWPVTGDRQALAEDAEYPHVQPLTDR
jgi:hypothetical protein